jgi:hypothetical protein
MKKITALLFSLLLLAVIALPTRAATPINSYEQSILTKLSTGIVVGTKTVVLADYELNIARNFFMMDGVEFTQADATVILNAIDSIAVIVKAAGVTDLTLLSATDKKAILAIAQAAVLGVTSIPLSFQYNFSTNIATIMSGSATMVSSAVSSTSTVIKNTGVDNSIALWIASILALSMAAGVVIAKKKNLLEVKV